MSAEQEPVDQSPWVSKLWSQKAKEEMKEEVAEEEEEEVAVVEELIKLEKQEVKDKTPDKLSRRPKMTSQPYEQCDLFEDHKRVG